MAQASTLYKGTFFRHPAQRSADAIVPVVIDLVQPRSVVDVGWSLCIAELPEESLPELPLSTIEFKDTGRRWFWTRSSARSRRS